MYVPAILEEIALLMFTNVTYPHDLKVKFMLQFKIVKPLKWYKQSFQCFLKCVGEERNFVRICIIISMISIITLM